ncbi:MAG: tyrosine recombinase XerC [Comamonadaceae bacterium]|nr:MAG: tyrosine recombinase XerC [Comamonadaceae bacterium]
MAIFTKRRAGPPQASDGPPGGQRGHEVPSVGAQDAALIEKYLEHVRVERRLAARTVELYAIHLRTLADNAAQARLAFDKVQPAHVRRWMAQLHSAGHEPRGIALVLSCWRSFFRWLGNEGLVAGNPVQDVKAPKAGRPLPKALAVDDAVRLAEHREPGADPRTEARDRAIVELLYGCGLRVSELTGLDARASHTAQGWVDLDALEASVLGKGSKRRSVPVGSKAVEALREWVALRGTHDDPALFLNAKNKRISPQAVWKLLRDRSLKAGLAAPVHPHMLRHSFASHVLQSSSDLRAVQELLGHANITTTQVYTRLDFQHLAKTYDAFHPRAKAKDDNE